MRLLPRRSAAIDKTGAKHLEWSGLRGGDLDLSVRTRPSATVCLTGYARRIVQSSNLNLSMDVGSDSLLCVAPGPHELCVDVDLEKSCRLRLAPRSSLVCIDWVRFPPPEELGGPNLLSWAARLGGYRSTSEVRQRDGVTARDTFSYELGGCKWAALSLELGAACSDAANLVVSGPRASGVADALRSLAASTDRPSSVSGCVLHEIHVHKLASAGVLGAARLRVREVAGDGDGQPVLVARLTTELSEDMYRLLALCLAPLQPQLGLLPYADRLCASATQRPPRREPRQRLSSGASAMHLFSTQPSIRMPPVAPPPPFPKVPHLPPPSYPSSFGKLPDPCC